MLKSLEEQKSLIDSPDAKVTKLVEKEKTNKSNFKSIFATHSR